ncbi:DUF6172 family protein [Arcobacter sp. LA11]|uniref:DUF6172 family protein n=1 Tax=Arcobacter sp. LA11 TaxID=1898176 RepID=UPI00093488D2|nr:DUF6172 family protein [Arcobacter sp. LA11]
MKKTFKLNEENKNPDRLLEAIKYEIRKYIKREKRKPLPEDVDFWDLKCKFAKNDEKPEIIDFVDITKCINEASNEKCDSFYMEIISQKGYRVKDVIKKDELEIDSEER